MSFMTNVAQNWPTLAAVIFSFAAGIGYLRWAKSQAAVNTIKLLEANISAQNVTIARIEGEKNALAEKLEGQTKLLREQSERITGLTQLVQGIPAWNTLREQYVVLAQQIEPALAILDEHCKSQDAMGRMVEQMYLRMVKGDAAA